MTEEAIQFNRRAVAPVECFKEAWSLIKEQYWLFFGICIVGVLIGSAFAIVLMGPMMCGIFRCLLQHMRREPVRFDGLFKGFDYFGQSVIAMLIQTIPTAIIIGAVSLVMMIGTVAVSASGGRAGKDAGLVVFVAGMALLLVVTLLVSIFVGVFFAFTFPLIVDRKLSGVDAVKTSARAAWANFGGVFGLVFLSFLLGMAGLMFCYVGAIFVMPVSMAAQAVAYRRVFPERPADSAVPEASFAGDP